ncbi:hypothetical protein G3444_16670 [Shewanella baltica]|uniref:hypothetical protein n=1 Tax=Shewanella baltica TaxID=62322 RepID=UPI00217EA8EF|nr:hypothetical protein [Shewanella baltica]MCS6120525.1 hypothetical protein [Shewanella baltica]
MSDPTLIAGLVGAGGSIIGALGGTFLGYQLNNSKPDIDIYIDNKVFMYYPTVGFSVYVPLTIINEGGKTGTIKDFELKIISATKQVWSLAFQDFGIDNTDQVGTGWGKGKDAHPIVVHGKTGTQHLLRFQNFSKLNSGKSEINLPAGEYELVIDAINRKGKVGLSKKHIVKISGMDQEMLDMLRNDPKNFKTYEVNVAAVT